MSDSNLQSLSVIDSDTVAGRNVVYCENVANANFLVGKHFLCASESLEFIIEAVSTGGTTHLQAFVYSGSPIPPRQEFEFIEIV